MNALHKNLIRRYLIWAYKTTKEAFERIERKTTQLAVDDYLLKNLSKAVKGKSAGKEYEQHVEEFKQYILSKKQDELKLKYADSQGEYLNPQYLYLKNRLTAIEEAIKHFLGVRELKKIENLYEEEFIRRILQSKEH
jgi:hypothetical protein